MPQQARNGIGLQNNTKRAIKNGLRILPVVMGVGSVVERAYVADAVREVEQRAECVGQW